LQLLWKISSKKKVKNQIKYIINKIIKKFFSGLKSCYNK
jgi:hypothetical protein